MWKFLKSRFCNKKKKIYPSLDPFSDSSLDLDAKRVDRLWSEYQAYHAALPPPLLLPFKFRLGKAVKEGDFQNIENLLVEFKTCDSLDDFQDVFKFLFEESHMELETLTAYAQNLISLFIKQGVHKLQTSKGETLLILINQAQLLPFWYYKPVLRGLLTEKLLKADKAGVNHKDQEGNTALYYAFLSYVSARRHHVLIDNLESHPISILTKYEATIEPIDEPLLRFFTSYTHYDSPSITEGCFCPRTHELISVAVVKQMILNGEILDYNVHNGFKHLVLKSIFEAKYPKTPEELKKYSDEVLIDLLKQVDDIKVITHFLVNNSLCLADEKGDINKLLFRLIIEIKSPFTIRQVEKIRNLWFVVTAKSAKDNVNEEEGELEQLENEREEERKAILTYYNSVCGYLKQKVNNEFPKTIQCMPYAGIVSDYLFPKMDGMDVVSSDNLQFMERMSKIKDF